MLTKDEQAAIEKAVRAVVHAEKTLPKRVARNEVSPKSLKQSKEKAWGNLRDLLKEVG